MPQHMPEELLAMTPPTVQTLTDAGSGPRRKPYGAKARLALNITVPGFTLIRSPSSNTVHPAQFFLTSIRMPSPWAWPERLEPAARMVTALEGFIAAVFLPCLRTDGSNRVLQFGHLRPRMACFIAGAAEELLGIQCQRKSSVKPWTKSPVLCALSTVSRLAIRCDYKAPPALRDSISRVLQRQYLASDAAQGPE